MTMIRSKNCAPPPFRERPRGTGLAGFLAGPGTRESKLLRRSTVVRAAASDRPIAAAVAAASGSGLTPVAAAAAAAKISTAAAAAKKTLVRELPGQQQQKPGGAAVEEEENLWHSVGTSSGSVFLADAAMWQSALPELDFTDERFSDDDQSPIAVAAPPTVRDYMTRRPVCVHPRASLKAAAKLMAACAVSGVPVVEPYDDDAGAGADGAGRLVGVLSQRDVLWKETVPYPGEDDLMGEPYEGPMSPSLRAQLGKIRSRTVADAMTAPALFVEAGALLSDAATIMINRNVRPAPPFVLFLLLSRSFYLLLLHGVWMACSASPSLLPPSLPHFFPSHCPSRLPLLRSASAVVAALLLSCSQLYAVVAALSTARCCCCDLFAISTVF
ncbi:unnamed protein product [Closterium sp. NIES-65]|nr:unnamed protein product [Closterium sp. NIES-65]